MVRWLQQQGLQAESFITAYGDDAFDGDSGAALGADGDAAGADDGAAAATPGAAGDTAAP